jgi:hypothetical protein
MNFTPKRAAEVETYSVDFSPLLKDGVTITSASWTVTTVHGTDKTSDMLDGGAEISGGQVHQRIGGGVPGLTYVPICTAQTSDGQTLILPDPGYGYLPVV